MLSKDEITNSIVDYINKHIYGLKDLKTYHSHIVDADKIIFKCKSISSSEIKDLKELTNQNILNFSVSISEEPEFILVTISLPIEG